jgi:periplasmic protein TonB
MTLQTKGFGWSIGIHGLIILVIAILQFSTVVPARIAVVDFTLVDHMPSDAVGLTSPQPKKEPRQKAERPIERSNRKIIEQTIPSPAVQKPPAAYVSFSGKEVSTSPEPVPDSSPSTPASFAQSTEAAGAAHNVVEGSSASSDAMSGTGEQVNAIYFKEHFSYIRDRITKNISYPHLARKKGWHGRVKIAFVICEDGGVIDVRVIESCGFNLLDQNTVDTVKKVAPFPCPPARAEIRMAISYRLN